MILTALRERTRAQHERLEARLGILDRTRCLDRYAALLERLYGFYGAVEPMLTDRLRRDPQDGSALLGAAGWTARRKLPRLARDLAALGRGPEVIGALPLCPEPPDLSSRARSLGCLYVLEGATLGGRIIARHLEETHGLTEVNGAAFFHGYGPRTGRMWKAFGAALGEEVAAAPCLETEVISGACDTFARYEEWVCSSGPAPCLEGAGFTC